MGEMTMNLKLIKIRNVSGADERVVIKILQKCDVSQYLLFDQTYDEEGIQSNKHRHVYVFPDIQVNKGDYICLYTKKGTYYTHENRSGTLTHNLYMGLEKSIWNNSGDVAYLLHYDDWENIKVQKQ